MKQKTDAVLGYCSSHQANNKKKTIHADTSRIINSEEDVKFKFLVPLLEEYGYKQDCIAFNVSISVQEGRKKKTIYADAIVYASKTHTAPLIVCETKAPTEILNREAREQTISYARLLPHIAPLALLTNGSQVQIFHTLHKTRRPYLPYRNDLEDDILKFVLDPNVQETLRKEAKHELFIIDDVCTFKSILKACHSEIRNNEGLDPTAAFDEMSKVMFCKLFEEKENPQGNRFRLSVFDDSMKQLKINVVRKIFEDAKSSLTYANLFHKDTKIHLKDRTIRKIVELFENYDLGLTAFDVKGEAFEYFLGDTFTGGLGEFFTPRNIVEFMVEAADPKIGEKIIDPFCGTGGFMIYAFDIVSEKIRIQEFSLEEKQRWRLELSNHCLFGTDWKERTSQACKMNMMVHGDGSSGVFMHDGMTDIPGKIEAGNFDLCLTNPPFGSFENDSSVLNKYELGSGRNSQDRIILAMERALRLVKPGGFVATIVIDGVLNNISTKYVRDYLKRHAWIKGIVSLNSETFAGYGANAKTSVLFMEKKHTPDEGDQKAVFMAIARNTGLAPNGGLIAGNVLPDILLDYQQFCKGIGSGGQHSESWLSNLGDRLDAEFYAPTIATHSFNIETLSREIEITQKRINESYRMLSQVKSFFAELETEPMRLNDILDEVSVTEKIVSEKTYKLLGVRGLGEGILIREGKSGKEVKAKTLHRVSKGWIIYNRLFAFRGSFAITGNEHDGCYVSGEFPTFVTKPKIKNAELVSKYIVHCLNSPTYCKIIDAQSTGSTKKSRNRFNQKLFLNLTIQIPKAENDLHEGVVLLDKASELRSQQEHLLELVKNFREVVFWMIPASPSQFAQTVITG